MAAAAAVSSTSFLQPLTPLIAAAFGLTLPEAGRIGIAVQLGYAMGVLLAVPLGDVVDRRRLAITMLITSAGSLVVVSASRSALMFTAGSFLAGMATAVAYVIIPFVASHAPDHLRGRFIGQIMVGMLLATPIAWIGAGWLGQAAGWRSVYLVDASLILLFAVTIARILPPDRAATGGVRNWPVIMASLPGVLRTSRSLRERAVYCFLNVTGFIMLWTGLPILLGDHVHRLTSAEIGLFGLTAVPGALLAPAIGRMADSDRQGTLTIGLFVLAGVSWVGLALAASSHPALFAAALAANIGLMGVQVVNQAVVSAISVELRSRMTAIYISAGLVGAAVGAWLATVTIETGGWQLLCGAGAALSLVLIVVRLWFGRLRSAAQYNPDISPSVLKQPRE